MDSPNSAQRDTTKREQWWEVKDNKKKSSLSLRQCHDREVLWGFASDAERAE